jgi:HAD superfamily hydrolase (TIGR01509 family)
VTPPALAIFDIGNTLVRGPGRGPAKRLAEVLGLDAERRRALRDALMTRPFERPEEVAAFLGRPDAEPAVTELWRAQEHEAEPVEGALGALAALSDDGVRLALVSNIWRPYLTSVRRHFGAFFDAHIPEELQLFSFQVGRAKPDAAMFTRALAVARVSPADAVMVGDTYDEDIAPAAALGMRTIHVGTDVGSVADVARTRG